VAVEVVVECLADNLGGTAALPRGDVFEAGAVLLRESDREGWRLLARAGQGWPARCARQDVGSNLVDEGLLERQRR